MKKLNAVAQWSINGWKVTVTNVETAEVTSLLIIAPTEKDAVFKAMEQVNDQ